VFVRYEVELWEWALYAFAVYAVGRFVLAYIISHIRRRK
jgi:hypothetical protein